jgi:hypothetical protein
MRTWVALAMAVLSMPMSFIVFAEMSREGVFPQRAVDGFASLNLEDGKIRASPEMFRNALPVICCNCDFH